MYRVCWDIAQREDNIFRIIMKEPHDVTPNHKQVSENGDEIDVLVLI